MWSQPKTKEKALSRCVASDDEKMDKEPSANGVDNVLKEIYAVAERR